MTEPNRTPSRRLYDSLAEILLSGADGTQRDTDGTFYYDGEIKDGPSFRVGDHYQYCLVDPPENTEAQKEALKNGLSVIEVQVAQTAISAWGYSEYVIARPDVISPNSIIKLTRQNMEKGLERGQETDPLSTYVVYNFQEGIIRDPLEHDVLGAVYKQVASLLANREAGKGASQGIEPRGKDTPAKTQETPGRSPEVSQPEQARDRGEGEGPVRPPLHELGNPTNPALEIAAESNDQPRSQDLGPSFGMGASSIPPVPSHALEVASGVGADQNTPNKIDLAQETNTAREARLQAVEDRHRNKERTGPIDRVVDRLLGILPGVKSQQQAERDVRVQGVEAQIQDIAVQAKGAQQALQEKEQALVQTLEAMGVAPEKIQALQQQGPLLDIVRHAEAAQAAAPRAKVQEAPGQTIQAPAPEITDESAAKADQVREAAAQAKAAARSQAVQAIDSQARTTGDRSARDVQHLAHLLEPDRFAAPAPAEQQPEARQQPQAAHPDGRPPIRKAESLAVVQREIVDTDKNTQETWKQVQDRALEIVNERPNITKEQAVAIARKEVEGAHPQRERGFGKGGEKGRGIVPEVGD